MLSPSDIEPIEPLDAYTGPRNELCTCPLKGWRMTQCEKCHPGGWGGMLDDARARYPGQAAAAKARNALIGYATQRSFDF